MMVGSADTVLGGFCGDAASSAILLHDPLRPSGQGASLQGSHKEWNNFQVGPGQDRGQTQTRLWYCTSSLWAPDFLIKALRRLF